jgi:aminoglycoside phosphotransferase (APT) family kinase protein
VSAVGDAVADSVAVSLANRLADQGFGRPRELEMLSGGARAGIWAFRAEGPDGGDLSLVLRLDPPGSPSGSIGQQAAAISAAGERDVPVPAVVDWSEDDEPLGSPFLVMTRMDGEAVPTRILRDQRFAAARSRLAPQIGAAAARIHAIPIERVPGAGSTDGVRRIWDRYVAVGVVRPVLELAFQWLDDHRPPATAPALVHGDLRLGNVLVDEHGLAAVLDWELVHVGDPMEDLGYLSIRAWRFGGPRPVAGIGGFDDLFDGYVAGGGERPDPERVRWWQIAGTLNWGTGCLMQAERHFTGGEHSMELAAIGRRVVEQEFDLLRMMDGDL